MQFLFIQLFILIINAYSCNFNKNRTVESFWGFKFCFIFYLSSLLFFNLCPFLSPLFLLYPGLPCIVLQIANCKHQITLRALHYCSMTILPQAWQLKMIQIDYFTVPMGQESRCSFVGPSA